MSTSAAPAPHFWRGERGVLGGEALGRFAIALIQGAFVFLGTWLVFGVDWGSPVGAVLTIVVFAAVASAAAMLLGSLVSNDRQADGIADGAGEGRTEP